VAERCVKIGCPEYLRIALMDACTGESIDGAGNGALIPCSRNVTAEKVIRDEEVSEFVSDCGYPDRYVQDAQLQAYNLSFELSSWSPELEALLNGNPLLDNGSGVNVGYVEEGNVGCSAAAPDPRFFVELFYRIRQCDPGSSVAYKRLLVPGMRFKPSENDKEGQIGFMRYSGSSEPMLTSGINYGPYNDVSQSIAADLNALATANPNHTTIAVPFVDELVTDPSSGLTLAANTCYMATVPVQTPFEA